MKASEIRSMTREELDHEINELREEEFRLRLRRPTEDLPNALRLRTIRRDIARIETVIREDKLGIIKLPSKSVRETKKADAAALEKKEEHVKKEPEKKALGKKAAGKKSVGKKAVGKKAPGKKAPPKKAAKAASSKATPKKKAKSESGKKDSKKASKGTRK